MSAGQVPLFRSTGHRGYSSEISADPRRVFARKLEREIDVRFTPVACTVKTSEGVVHAAPGDAIITGTAGEHWRVSRARFSDKYRPVPPTVAGQSGRYISLPNRIMAVPMTEPFEVLLAFPRFPSEFEEGAHAGAGLARREQAPEPEGFLAQARADRAVRHRDDFFGGARRSVLSLVSHQGKLRRELGQHG